MNVLPWWDVSFAARHGYHARRRTRGALRILEPDLKKDIIVTDLVRTIKVEGNTISVEEVSNPPCTAASAWRPSPSSCGRPSGRRSGC